MKLAHLSIRRLLELQRHRVPSMPRVKSEFSLLHFSHMACRGLLPGHRDVAAEFNRRHPDREPLAHTTVGRMLKKFQNKGNVVDVPRAGRPSTSAGMEETVLTKMCSSQNKST
uniref:DUF4817 domain-containing protein n=1 Tax=Timema poppense TaxID=170557 RepID=A0A7R9CUB5_TIMPO|nr:unnamed protein product [Timema poppensis]